MTLRSDPPKTIKNTLVYFGPNVNAPRLYLFPSLRYFFKFTLPVTPFSHERTIKLSNLSFVILLLNNFFKDFSLVNDLSLLETDCGAVSKSLYTLATDGNVTELWSQLLFWYLFICLPPFLSDNPKVPLVLLSVLRCLGYNCPSCLEIHRMILWIFLIK